MSGAIRALEPTLSVRGGKAAIAFYTEAFGAIVLFRHEGEDGNVVAKLAAGPAEFWVSDEAPEYQNLSPAALGGTSVRLVLIADDPAALFARAVGAGATAVCPVRDEDSWRIGRILDPFGHMWEIGKPLED